MEVTSENQENKNTFVYLDIAIGGEHEGRIIIELFENIAPKTCKNFKALCTGECKRNGKKLCYKGSIFYRVMRGFIIQGGDIDNNDGTGGESIYGQYFDDETFEIKHEEGIVSMANSGYKNTNGSQFFIVTDYDIAEIDGQNVAFGKVVSGMDVVKSIESQRTISVESGGEKPIDDCVISDCGVWEEGMKKIGPEDGYPIFPRYYEAENPDYLEIAQSIKQNGNNKFCTGNYKSAVNLYKKALRYLMYYSYPSSEENEKTKLFHKLAISLHLNEAACYIKMKDYDPAITECIIVLDHPKALKGDKIKASYRKGVCFYEQQKYQDAFDSFKKASALDGGKDPQIKKYLVDSAAAVRKEKELLKNMSKGISENKGNKEDNTISFSLVGEDTEDKMDIDVKENPEEIKSNKNPDEVASEIEAKEV
jgi:peptidyl-prolyl isomerase D